MSFSKNIFFQFGCVAMVALTIACSKDEINTSDNNRIDTKKIVKSSSTNQVASAELTKAAEALMQSLGFQYADEVLKQAIALDPQNKKAVFLQNILGTISVYKGFYQRVKPLAAKIPGKLEEITKMEQEIPNGAYRDFLFAESAPIQNEADLQNLISDIKSAYSKLGKYVKNNKDLSMDISITNSSLIESKMRDFDRHCTLVEISEGAYELQNVPTHNGDRFNCDLKNSLVTKINRADLEAIQQISFAAQIYLSLGNRYSLAGLVNATNNDQFNNLSKKDKWEVLTSNSAFGVLREKSLVNMTSLGMDFIAAVDYVKSMQESLCPSGSANKARSGYLFNNGVCVDEEGGKLEQDLALVESLLGGGITDIKVRDTYETQVKPLAAFQTPVADLKSLKPKFNHCDKVTQVSNSSLNGLFPNNDVNTILYVENENCR